ncbi:MAG: hypothetical protein QM499_05480 [Flavobacteriaceae bacterium]
MKISLSFGDFYFFDYFIISEIFEGVVLDCNKGKQILKIAKKQYGSDLSKIILISNRINSYSLIPQNWLKFDKTKNTFKSYFIIPYNLMCKNNIRLEEYFSEISFKYLYNLDIAVNKALCLN